MEDSNLRSEVAVLKAEWKHTQDAIGQLHCDVKELNVHLSGLTKTMTKYQGAGLALLFAVPALWSALSLALSLWIKR